MFSTENNSNTENTECYTEYGVCRCCMAKGRHRDVSKEYYFNNLREVYKDIFKECFNLSLTLHKNISSLICCHCVRRLRDAISFRMMVVSTEQQLLNSIVHKAEQDNKTEFIDVPGRELTSEIKLECEIDTEVSYGDFSTQIRVEEFDENEEHFESDAETTRIIDDEHIYVEGESEFLARFAGTLKPLPERNDLLKIYPAFAKHLSNLKDKIVKPKSIERFFQKSIKAPKRLKKPDKKITSDKIALALNATVLFENSNATAFKSKMRNGYPCFYCRQIYQYDTIKEHQTIHPKSSIYKLLTKYTADELIVYADITDLKCTICEEDMKNLSVLKTHLQEKHNKKIYLDYPDRVIPFKLKEMDLECQICGRQFETFGAVERHMNMHFRNFICEECGAGFITKHRLSVHAYNKHKIDTIQCNICKKTFGSQLKHKIHYDTVHRLLKKYKCSKCDEKFIDYFTRQKHLVEVHNVEPILYKCKVCDRGFNRKFSLTLHVKRCHLAQKDFQCQFCSYQCFTNTELKEHHLRHGGVKPFVCSVCKKAYSRNKALVLHMRVHNNDRRYICSVCGIAFVQKGSLVSHMHTHEAESGSLRG
ncbi:zinc finger protein 91-like [Helicoverpa armigera]|uniref:zinc finger protein 91-like n=1 Tax=Helicoverpa armigera TaxID=29058 RepID=UPI003083D8E6